MGMDIRELKIKAEGHWEAILNSLAPEAIPALEKIGRAVPCPVHGGSDGFHFFKKNFHSTGGGICNTCGAKADGISILQWIRGWSFPEAIDAVAQWLGEPEHETRIVKRAPPRSNTSNGNEIAKAIQARWEESDASEKAAQVIGAYLKHRGLKASPELLAVSRLHPNMKHFEDGQNLGSFPCMITKVCDKEGKPVTINRLWFSVFDDCNVTKATVPKPKKMYSIIEGKSVSGGAVRLGKVTGRTLGLAEGIETALAVNQATGMVVWATLTATLIAAFEPPKGVTEIVVWADKDRPDAQGNKAGEDNALLLKERLEPRGISVRIEVPNGSIPTHKKSLDWLDVYNAEGVEGFPEQ